MLDLIVKNGHIVNAHEELDADIAVKDGKIVEIGDAEYFPEAKETVDASDLLVFPGLIDSHVHIQSRTSPENESLDNYYNGSIAAAYGGTTTFVDFALPSKTQTPAEAMEEKLEKAKGQCVVNYSFHSGINRGDAQSFDDVAQLRKSGFPSVKVFTVYRNNLMLEKPDMLEVMRSAGKDGGLVMIHAESADLIEHNIEKAVQSGKTLPIDHADSRPIITEMEAISSVLSMQKETGVPIILAHTTAGQARHLLNAHPNKNVFVEVCPHYLILTKSLYKQSDGYKYVCSPPFRTEEERKELWKMLEQGFVQLINSDHTDYSIGQKVAHKNYFPDIPNGMPTLETRGTVFFSESVAKGRISLCKFVELTSTNAARLMGMYPQKGILQAGADADIVLFDPKYHSIHTVDSLHMQTDYSPFAGMEMTGRVVDTIVDGNIVIDQGKYRESAFRGMLVKRKNNIM